MGSSSESESVNKRTNAWSEFVLGVDVNSSPSFNKRELETRRGTLRRSSEAKGSGGGRRRGLFVFCIDVCVSSGG